MPAVLEAPKTTRTPKGPRWSREQAIAAHKKGLETRRKNAVKRKEVKREASALFQAINCSDPITDVEHALALAAKRGHAKACEHLSLALARLKAKPKQPGSNYTPTPCSPVRQPTPATPQVTQHAHVQEQASQASFAQYTEPLVQNDKESLKPGTVTAPTGVGTGHSAGGGGVIEHNTRGPNSVLLSKATVEQLEARLKELRANENVRDAKTQPVSCGLVGPVPVSGPGSIGPAPQEGVEKFCVNGVWVWGRRKK